MAEGEEEAEAESCSEVVVVTASLLAEDDAEMEADIGAASGSCGGSGLLSTRSCCASLSPDTLLPPMLPPLPAMEREEEEA